MARKAALFFIIAAGCSIVCSLPLRDESDPEITGGKFEGDMILTESQEDALTRPQIARNGLVDVTKRWPNAIVYYKIIGNFDSSQREAIKAAIDKIESSTCVRFREAGVDDKSYVAIGSKPGGCFTAVGFQNKVQEMNLEKFPVGEGCFRAGSILHEFMHALGFYHEQSASDRDDFIEVKYENVSPGKEFNFAKYSSSIVTDFGVGYDYDSCLHYGPRAFSLNGEDTIVPLKANVRIGQRVGISKKDIDKINIMYKCPIKI